MTNRSIYQKDPPYNYNPNRLHSERNRKFYIDTNKDIPMIKILKWLGIRHMMIEEWIPKPGTDFEEIINQGQFIRRNDALSRRMVFEYLLKKWDYQCAYCGKCDDSLEVDHIIPKSRKGTEKINNFALSCRECNLRKSISGPTHFGLPGNGRNKTSNYDLFPFCMIRYKMDNEKNWRFGEKTNDFIPFGFSFVRIKERKHLIYKSRRLFANSKEYGILRGKVILFGRKI